MKHGLVTERDGVMKLIENPISKLNAALDN